MAGLVVTLVSLFARAKACLGFENGANATAYSMSVVLVAATIIGGANLLGGLTG